MKITCNKKRNKSRLQCSFRVARKTLLNTEAVIDILREKKGDLNYQD